SRYLSLSRAPRPSVFSLPGSRPVNRDMGVLSALSGLLLLPNLAYAYPEIHVQFPHSEVNSVHVVPWPYGNAPFKCSGGCRVYSPTPYDSVYITDASGKRYKSLRELSNMMPGQPYQLPAGNSYQL
ncbi:hypothetical protein PMAYCL1PPCAC_14045, partial [Pristionchus mayeri]